MSNSRLLSLFSVAALGLGLTISASATTVVIGGSAPAGSTNTSFDTGLPSNWVAAGPNAGTASTSVTNQYTQPAGDTTPFAYVGVGSSLTANFAGGITSLDLLWGSPDTWNFITFVGTGGSVTYSPGSGLLASLSPVNSGSQTVLFTAGPGVIWTSVIFTSTLAAFEFDNVSTLAAATASATPEPATLALLAGGLLAIGIGTVRRRKI